MISNLDYTVAVTEIPNDADGDALRNLQADGFDLTKPMEIDFPVAAPTEAACKAIAAAAESAGFTTTCVEEEDHEWTCWCTKIMAPQYKDIIAVQKQLDELSIPHGGYSDGWGTFGEGPEEANS